jgi:hypothetical protein
MLINRHFELALDDTYQVSCRTLQDNTPETPFTDSEGSQRDSEQVPAK